MTIALNENLKVIAGDIGNAYVHAECGEKIYSQAGPEFGNKEGATLVIKKALYGLATSGRQWGLLLGDTLRDQGFSPTQADPSLWIKWSTT